MVLSPLYYWLLDTVSVSLHLHSGFPVRSLSEGEPISCSSQFFGERLETVSYPNLIHQTLESSEGFLLLVFIRHLEERLGKL